VFSVLNLACFRGIDRNYPAAQDTDPPTPTIQAARRGRKLQPPSGLVTDLPTRASAASAASIRASIRRPFQDRHQSVAEETPIVDVENLRLNAAAPRQTLRPPP
jgi:hypothetical protein